MKLESGVLAVFDDPRRAVVAVRALHGAGFAEVRAAMPAPFPELVDALGEQSGLGWGAFSGGVLGVAIAFALCIGTSLDWPLQTGGKAIVSLPPFVVIAFETLIAGAAILDLLEISIRQVRARRRRPMPRDPRFTADRVGVFVPAGDLVRGEISGFRLEQASVILRESGAEEVKHVD